MPHDAPSPHDLLDNPELAALDILDRAAHVAMHALLAAHPVLMTEESPDDRDEAANRAVRILAFVAALTDDIECYRSGLDPHRASAM